MIPGASPAEHRGVAYAFDAQGHAQLLYRTQGWHSNQVFVSGDGRRLVQMGPWSPGTRPSADHLAVAFHSDGKLIASYSTAQLLKDHDAVSVSVSHYQWMASKGDLRSDFGFDPYLHDDLFHLVTLDGIHYSFDTRNGRIVGERLLKVGH